MSDLTTDERLALIERLEQQEATRRRAAIRAAWASVAGATLVFALVVLGGWWSIRLERAELTTIDAERQELQERVEALRREATAVEAQLKSTEAARAAALGALGRVPEKEREAAVSANPDVAKLIPRAYLQVVEEADRGFANEIGRRLQAGGVVAAGVEYVPAAAKVLKRNEVRYYKDREIDGAKRIVALLAQAGVDADLKDLNMEANTKVRPYHFEVWFAAGARNSASAASRPADTPQATQQERTAHVEVVILTHNSSADQAVHTVVMSPLPSGSGPDRSHVVTGGRLMAEVAPGRYSVTVKDAKMAPQEFARRVGEGGTLVFRPEIDLDKVVGFRNLPVLSDLPRDLRDACQKIYTDLSDTDKAHLLNLYVRLRAPGVTARTRVSGYGVVPRPLTTFFRAILGPVFSPEAKTWGIRVRMTPTSDTSAQHADLLRRLRQRSPAIDMFDEPGGTTLFAFRPARERYVPDDEMKLAARVHQDLLRIYLAPMFDIVLQSDATTPPR